MSSHGQRRKELLAAVAVRYSRPNIVVVGIAHKTLYNSSALQEGERVS